MENSRTDKHRNLRNFQLPKTKSVPVQVRERVGADVTDICDAPVSTEWFFYTNANHRLATKIDLLFTNNGNKPLVPYTPAESLHCTRYEVCEETLRLAREIYPAMDKIILDMNIPYHTPSRNAFCKYWKANYGENGELLKNREGGRQLKNVSLSPTATSFVAYLYKVGMADNVYSFTNVLVRPIFVICVRRICRCHSHDRLPISFYNNNFTDTWLDACVRKSDRGCRSRRTLTSIGGSPSS